MFGSLGESDGEGLRTVLALTEAVSMLASSRKLKMRAVLVEQQRKCVDADDANFVSLDESAATAYEARLTAFDDPRDLSCGGRCR